MSGQPSLFDDLPDPERPLKGRHHRIGPETERIAAAQVMPRSGTQRAKVLAAYKLQKGYGCTDNELHFVFKIGARPHVPATRREELQADGWPIIDSGQRRRTDTGSPAIVWVLEEDHR